VQRLFLPGSSVLLSERCTWGRTELKRPVCVIQCRHNGGGASSGRGSPPTQRVRDRGLTAPLGAYSMSYLLPLLPLVFCTLSAAENAALQRNCPEFYYCGPNAVYMLLRMTGHDVQFASIMPETRRMAQGASLKDMRDELAIHGLATDLLRCEPADLPRIPPPFIMYTYPPKSPGELGHYVVAVAVNEETLQVVDATTGLEKTYRIEKISNIWDGIVILPLAPRLGASYIAAIAIVAGALLFYRHAASLVRRPQSTVGPSPAAASQSCTVVAEQGAHIQTT
jgi:hypothetical protein